MKVRRMAAGIYELDTRGGTHTVVRLVVTSGMDGWEHRRPGTYWLHTLAGEFAPSGEHRTLSEAIDYIRKHFDNPAPTPRYVVEDLSSWSRVRDTVTGMDVCNGTREGCERDAGALNAGTLSLDSFGRIKR